MRAVAHYGLGKDMWEVEPDNITEILYVSNTPRFVFLLRTWSTGTRHLEQLL